MALLSFSFNQNSSIETPSSAYCLQLSIETRAKVPFLAKKEQGEEPMF